MSGSMQKQRSDATKQAIVHTATEMALSQGMDALSVRKISAALGYSTGVIYHHFRDKEEIIHAMLQKQGDILRGEILRATQDCAAFDDTLRAVYSQVLAMAREKPALYQLISLRYFDGNMRDSKPYLMLEKMLQTYFPSADISKIHAVSHAIWSSFIGFNLSISQNAELSDSEADTLFEAQLTMIMKGIIGVME